MQSTPDDKPFDWLLDGSIAVERQDALAVYLNNADHIVIRRESAWDEENDTTIIIAPQNVTAFLQAVIRASGLPLELIRRVGGGYEDVEDHLAGGAVDRADAGAGLDADKLSDPPPAKPSSPKDATAADRQRRHREKLQRNAVTPPSDVTDRHGNDDRDTVVPRQEQFQLAAEAASPR
jgi:hypothetical protein